MPDVPDLLERVVAQLGGTPRQGQEQMAQAVAEALSSGEHLLVQAGTGTGKSLGYLVPSFAHAASTGERVVVATATLALQHQLLSRDLPVVARALASVVESEVGYAVVKGRANYGCLHKVRDGAPGDENQGEIVEVTGVGAEVLTLREWVEDQATSSGSGDRDDAPSHSDASWSHVSVSSRECIGAQKCRWATECFAERARAQAQQAELIVTNHALLAIDAIDGVPMLPAADLLVVDEAHELVSRVTQASTLDLDPALVERAARSAGRQLRSGDSATTLSDAAESLADALTHERPGRLLKASPSLTAALEFVRDAARPCLSELRQLDGSTQGDVALQQTKALVEDVWTVAERMANAGQSEVLWLGQAQNRLQLHLAPVDIAGPLQEKLFATKTVVLTSATLTIGGSFEPVARSWGLAGADEYVALDVGSPFDYQRQGVLYVAKHLPAPSQEGLAQAQLDEITALVKAAGGRTLGLFSSRRAAETAAEHVRAVLPDRQLWCQGDAHLSDLATRFAESPESSLFGTLSLWQGLDIPGPSCSLVIIDKIPFPRPDDPVLSARQELVERSGGNGFMQVPAQHAALLLAQGAGRLIRRSDDRGVVAILDPRIVTARYGSFMAAGLPPMWRTTDRRTVLAALRRLDAEASTAVHGADMPTR